ncbi:hypothetical protein EN871_04080 [bacterium M00.F.Ca.ET.228.01.1.1]|nr:hypothetical protein EN871_04080 [bacterium M00.F.Ca.ET.228.01.1.1]TGS05782.1 hypothetical protein EN834_04080 [bacterium M00.F.Ca.ET.191.01.1.1]TGU10719.1 hypothetical protein EN798_04080 [bacterium M00.F.Ca.ET.155.01.1.1]
MAACTARRHCGVLRRGCNALQNAFDRRSTAEIAVFCFDLVLLDGADPCDQPLRSRGPHCVN